MIFVCYSPTGQLDAYIKNLERVLDAIEFFNQNNPSCVELTNLVCVTFLFHFTGSWNIYGCTFQLAINVCPIERESNKGS